MVGYLLAKNVDISNLPSIKNGVLNPSDYFSSKKIISKEVAERINLQYSNNYQIVKDIYIIFRAFKKLGN